jgi:hypothetical protein
MSASLFQKPFRLVSFRSRASRRAFFASIGVTLIACALAPVPAFAQADDPLVDEVSKGKEVVGRVNFNAGVIRAIGYGAPPPMDRASSGAQARLMSLGAAKTDALRNLAMAVSSVQVTAETTVKNYVLENDTVKTRLSALIRNARLISEKYQPDGTCVATMEMPLYGAGSVGSVIYPEVLPESSGSAPLARDGYRPLTPSVGGGDYGSTPRVSLPAPVAGVPGAPAGGAGADRDGNFTGPKRPAVRVEAPKPAPAPAPLRGPEPGPTPLSDAGPFTSVLIDCRGLGVSAIMSPKLYDTTGREIYGTVRVDPEYAIETGIVSYPRSMAEAIRSARAGKRPLVIKAVRVADTQFRTNPVISVEDGDRILAANNRDGFLEQTRVIFLVDPIKY